MKKLGVGVFGTNPKLSTIVLSKGLTEIPGGAFGCSDGKNWMADLTELTIPEGITKIGNNAFAGNNIKNIVIPSTVKEIGNYAFSTKNYLHDECTLFLPEGLTKIGTYAFRNKVIKEVELPSTVTALKANTFTKEYSDETQVVITKVYVTKEQYKDSKNFPTSSYHEYAIKLDPNDTKFDEFDFNYDEISQELYPARDMAAKTVVSGVGITGLSESGKAKLEKNKDLVIPEKTPEGKTIIGIGTKAFYNMGLTSVTFPEGVMAEYTGSKEYIADGVTQRGNFIIANNAFANNNFTSLELPEGVIYIGGTAFRNNKSLKTVKLPRTLWMIASQAFAGCSELSIVDFPETCDFELNIDAMAFAQCAIKAVRMPDRLEKLSPNTFFQCTGMEPVSEECTNKNLKKGGVVYMYSTNKELANGAYVAHVDGTTDTKSWVQKFVFEEMPEELKGWTAKDFTYSEDGTAITGLSESGVAKRASLPDMIMPDESPEGTVITAIGDGGAGGLFATEEEQIKSVVLPKSLKKIGMNAFRSCGLEKITFPETLEELGVCAFQTNNLTNVELPDSVKTVGDGAFASNDKLTAIKLSAAMTEIPKAFAYAPNDMPNLTAVEIPEGITKIGSRAFSGNAFKSVKIPASVKTIDSYAFSQSEKTEVLERVELAEGLESIGADAFKHSVIKSLELPSTVITLHKYVFRASKGDAVKVYVSNQEQFDLLNKAAAGATYKLIYTNLIGSGWSADDFVFDGATVKGWSEKGNKTRLENKVLVIPSTNPETGDAITAIADGAFAIPDGEWKELKDGYTSPNGMKSVEIPSTVTSIGAKAFEYNSLEEVQFPEELSDIGISAFHGNQLKKVELPDSVTSVSEGAFAANNITELKLSKRLKKLEQGVFSMNIRLEQIDLPEGLEEIGDMAFAGARLTSLKIPSTVTKIGRKAFHLHHLTELTVPGNVKEIGDSAFEGTFKAVTLKKLVLEEGIESIGEKAFKEGYLEKVLLPTTLTSLAADAFENNAGVNNDHVVACYVNRKDQFASLKSDSLRIVPILDVVKEKVAVTLSTTSYTYNGEVRKPSVTAKTADGEVIPATQYTVKYESGRKNVGKYTVKVTFKDQFKGEISKTFSIVPKGTSITKVAAGTKTMTVTFKAQKTQTTAYQIQYSTDKAFKKNVKSLNTAKNTTTVKKITKLTSKKTYYARIRTFKEVKINGKTVKLYSKWSKVKSVKVK